jgi:hypothetical protein
MIDVEFAKLELEVAAMHEANEQLRALREARDHFTEMESDFLSFRSVD